MEFFARCTAAATALSRRRDQAPNGRNRWDLTCTCCHSPVEMIPADSPHKITIITLSGLVVEEMASGWDEESKCACVSLCDLVLIAWPHVHRCRGRLAGSAAAAGD